MDESVKWCEELYGAHAAQLLLYGRALGLSHSEAEDVLHETFLALMRLPEPPRQPRHYCVRSFRNRALNYRRSVWRRVAREFEAGHWFEPSPDRPPVEEDAMRCLARLPREQREVIVLKIWHGYTFEAIAELLDISPNTIAGRYRYGMQKLREGLQSKTKHETGYERNERFGEPFAFLGAPHPLPGN